LCFVSQKHYLLFQWCNLCNIVHVEEIDMLLASSFPGLYKIKP
jgi:hypothetical protein